MVGVFCFAEETLNERPRSPEGTAAKRRGGNVDVARMPAKRARVSFSAPKGWRFNCVTLSFLYIIRYICFHETLIYHT